MAEALRPVIVKWRYFAPEIILCAVRGHLRYPISSRDVQELLVERGLEVTHPAIWRRVQRYAPEPEERTRPHLKPTNRSWRIDEIYRAGCPLRSEIGKPGIGTSGTRERIDQPGEPDARR
jgi:hypothetical protein